jgi:predicted cobalt transporter CbtA
MKLNFRVILAFALVAITVYDIVASGFHYKHAIFLGIAGFAIYMAINKK